MTTTSIAKREAIAVRWLRECSKQLVAAAHSEKLWNEFADGSGAGAAFALKFDGCCCDTPSTAFGPGAGCAAAWAAGGFAGTASAVRAGSTTAIDGRGRTGGTSATTALAVLSSFSAAADGVSLAASCEACCVDEVCAAGASVTESVPLDCVLRVDVASSVHPTACGAEVICEVSADERIFNGASIGASAASRGDGPVEVAG